jgi:anti-sigma factor RsiW
MTDDLRQKLNDYVDGELANDDIEAIEAILANDQEAQAEVVFLKQLAHDASALPQVIAPQRDLWAGVADGVVLRQKLNDYVDGALSQDDIAAIEVVLANDQEAQAEVAFLQQLAHDASALPQVIAPRRDLWAGVANRIASKPALPWMRWTRFAVAAVLLVAASSAVTVLYMKQTIEVPALVLAKKEVTPILAAFQASEQTYSTAIDQLTKTMHQRRDVLAPETVAAIEANLKVIDEAILASRVALDADPNNQASVHLILAMYKRKVDLLQQIVEMPYGG